MERYTVHSSLTNFMPLPRSLLQLQLPTTAMVLYAMLLDRGTLSQKHDYTDFGGWVYVVYPIHELRENLHLSDTTIKDNLRLLEGKGLIRRIRRFRREASRIFLLVPQDGVTDRKPSCDGRKSVHHTAGKPTPNNRKKQQELNELYQHQEGESL